MGRLTSVMRSACGVVGPVAFTAAWVAATRRQPAYSVAHEHISGLAAPDARDPHLMTAGFAVLGSCSVAFGWELDRRLSAGGRSPGAGPALMAATGLAMLALAAFRRDRISNYPAPGEPDEPQSWRNDVHDISAILSAGGAVGSMLALAARFRGDPAWRDLTVPTIAAALASAALDVVFATDVTRPGNGVVQRIAVSLPLAGMLRIAIRAVRRA